MTENTATSLRNLLDRISQGVSISEFKKELRLFWKREFSERRYIKEIRFKRGLCKKFMDEVMPVAHFIKWNRIKEGFIKFPLDDQIPDCFLWPADGAEPRKIEVTVAQGKARFYLMKELVEKGTGRGFLDIQDDDSKENFECALAIEPSGYTTDLALASTKRAIELCLERKNHQKYASMDLLIQGPLNNAILPRERWALIRDDLMSVARGMPFQRIYVIGDGSQQTVCFQIK